MSIYSSTLGMLLLSGFSWGSLMTFFEGGVFKIVKILEILHKGLLKFTK